MRNLLEYEEFLFEFISHRDLDSVENYADKLFRVIGVDIEFTKHFFDRVNDARNGKAISSSELIDLFRRTYNQYGEQISKYKDEIEAVIYDTKSDINIPFVINIDPKGELDLVTKTIMRKKEFKTYTPKLDVK
jgi:hypothetical protein